MITTPAARAEMRKQGITMYGGWVRDERAFDPCAQFMVVGIGGQPFRISNLLGPGWPVTVRPAVDPGNRSATVNWGDWAAIRRFADRYLPELEAESAERVKAQLARLTAAGAI